MLKPHIEDYSVNPVITYELLMSDLDFTAWNKLVGDKMKNMAVAQHLGELGLALQISDQRDIDCLFSLFPEHHSAFVEARNREVFAVFN